jgi:hypothetical protein
MLPRPALALSVLVLAAAGCGGGDDPEPRASATPAASATATATPTASATASATATASASPSPTATAAVPAPSATAAPAAMAAFRADVQRVCRAARPQIQEAGFRAGQRAARQGLSDEEAQIQVIVEASPVIQRMLDRLRREVDPPPEERAAFNEFIEQIESTLPLIRRLGELQDPNGQEAQAIAIQVARIAISTRSWTARVGVPDCNPA